MYYYLVPKTGVGTDIDPYRPDIPIDTPFVSGVYYDSFIIGVDSPLSGATELTVDEVLQRAYTVGLDISSWFVR